MSPASKSKSKDKKAGKEPPKGSSKSSGHVNTSSGISATRYNPLLGAIQTFETTPGTSASLFHGNGRFRNIDDMDDQIGNSFGTGTEYDSVSNNGSWSGESEDHKEKAPQPVPRQESVPGAENDKREKIRQKNEKKHQRQKERRAQELHERCSGYLMSRKLEALAQQLVAMGFSQERATMALILNEGRVEESVAWLFEGGEEDKHREHNLDGGGNLKIDISEELARISDMEIRYKASKQEVERAVVSSEGDLDMAEETLKTQKQEPPATPPKPEAISDPPTVANGKVPMTLIQNAVRGQVRPTSSGIQQRDEKDFNYTKVAVAAGPSVDPGKSTQPLKKIPPNLEWVKPQQIAVPSDKRWATGGSNPSVSYSLASSLQASPPPAKTETRYMAVGNELKNLQLGSVREPVIVMQRPQSINLKQSPISSVSSSPPGTAMGWYPKSVETGKAIGLVSPVAVTRSLSSNDGSSSLLYNPLHYQSQPQFMSGSSSMDSQGITRANGSWNRGGASPTIVPASSLGLFSGLGINGSSGSSSSVDWTTGNSIPQFDYSNIDWSLDRGLLSSSRPNGLWAAPNYAIQNNTRKYDSFPYSVGLNSAIRPALSNENGASHPGLQERVSPSEPNNGSSREWASPFEEKDIFSLPRQFVSSPSH
ncbi:hypothetical protein F511_24975 [Dorcoceras hygrometricum]|uniref:UBA domain-containing protein n=1 Tax=Dorcoceras hygrometricum TaxID=472368 RepID=A0A2Z7AMX8_9LAMI|nr:hypothetical protein F511_24975 [Dorcoceras hygrometricum]